MALIRVLQVVTVLNMGGLETLIMNLYRNIDREKVQFDFLVHRHERGIYDDEIVKLGGNIFRISNISPQTLKKYKKELDDFFKNHNEYKIVHSHIDTLSTFVLKAAKKAGVSCRIAHSHTSKMQVDIKAIFRCYSRFFLNEQCTDFFACSKSAAAWLFRNRGIIKNRAVIFKNGINALEFQFDEVKRKNIREELGVTNKFVIGHVGRFDYEKNHDFLVNVFNEINKRNSDTILLLVGIGTLEEKLKEKVKILELQNKVRFLGLSSRIVDVLHAMDIFVFPSFVEGLGIALIEAQATGLRCIASDKIPDEAVITPLVERINLNLGAKYWAEKVINSADDYKRENMMDKISEEGYDITKSVKWLEQFYISHSN